MALKPPKVHPESRWKYTGDAGRLPSGKPLCHVECTCSNKTKKVVCRSNLIEGTSRSCGCLSKEAGFKKKKWPVLPPESRWTIIEEVGKKGRCYTYLVECSCPNKTRRVLSGTDLTTGRNRSCGCWQKERITETHKKYPILPPGCRWKILGEAGRNKYSGVTYYVECSCLAKTKKIVTGWCLTNGSTLSCGCLRIDIVTSVFTTPVVLPPDSRWRVIGVAGRGANGQILCHVECSCPAKTRKIVPKACLSQASKSCGCLRTEGAKRIHEVRVRLKHAQQEFGHLGVNLIDRLEKLEVGNV